MPEIKPIFTPEEANVIIELLEAKAKEAGRKSDFYRDIIANIQTTSGYLDYMGIEHTCNPGYHLTEIPRGEYGEISKILEEAAELKDAMEQGQKLMCLIEMSDILGAIEGYLEKYYEGKVTATDLFNMSYVTKRAFESGRRK